MDRCEIETEPDNSKRKAREISRQLAQIELTPLSAETEVDLTDTLTLTFDQISALGAAFAPVAKTFRTATLQLSLSSGEQLYRAILPKGAKGLKIAKDGTYWGAAAIGNSSKMVKFAAQNSAVAGTASIVMPYDPTALFMAVALVQVNQKLNRIESAQREMLKFMRGETRAKVKANLQALTRILNDFESNWDKERWLQGSYHEVRTILRSSEAEIIRLHGEIESELRKREVFQTRQQLSKQLANIVERFKDYQTALYTHSFASFLEPLLGEEYDREYLDSVSERIRSHLMEYRKLYTACYDTIESGGRSAIDSVLMENASKIGKAAGEALASTPVGKATPLDEALEKAGNGIARANEEQIKALMAKLIQAKAPDTVPFSACIERINEFYNSDVELLTNGESIYLSPCVQEDNAAREP